MRIADKNTTATELVKEALAKAEKFANYHIFTFINKENALRRAAEIDARIAKGEEVGRLAGVPYALKDNFLSPEGATTASARILEPFESPITATAVKKLEDEGAIMIGRTNLDAFAHGSSTENSYFGPTKNAADPSRVAGGSSGGSAVAVALGIVEFATGTDTGGSIRQPASFNGVYGFKPTYGTISRYGVVAMASSTDCVGFFARNAADVDLLMEIAAGQDPYDMTTLPSCYCNNDGLDTSSSAPASLAPVVTGLARSGSPSVAYAPSEEASSFRESGSSASEASEAACVPFGHAPGRSGQVFTSRKHASDFTSLARKIGIIKNFDNDAVSLEIRQALKNQVQKLEGAGYEIVELSMPALKFALAVYYIIVPAEVSSNLSRHDGIRYGYRSEDAKTLDEVYGKSRSDGFMPENKRRIMIGNFVLSSGFYDAYYLKATRARTLIIDEYNKAFEKCDFILTPVAPNPAFKFGEKTHDPVAMYLEDVMSVPLNLAGVPGLTIPVGQTADGLPLGLQLVGPRRSDRRLLQFAEQLTEQGLTDPDEVIKKSAARSAKKESSK